MDNSDEGVERRHAAPNGAWLPVRNLAINMALLTELVPRVPSAYKPVAVGDAMQLGRGRGRGPPWGHQSWGRPKGVLDSTTCRQPLKSEIRGPKPERRPNTEGRNHARAFLISGFGLLSASGFRASGLGLCAHGLVVLSSTPCLGSARTRALPFWRRHSRLSHVQ